MNTEEHLDLPYWLAPDKATAPVVPCSPKERKRLTKQALEMSFEAMFERVLSQIAKGRTLKSLLDEDLRDVEYELFWRWMRRDPSRVERFKEAKEMRAEWREGRVIEIVEGVNNSTLPDDVARCRLQFDAYKWLMAADDRRTFGDSKSIEMNSTSISVTGALEQANARIASLRPITIDQQPVSDELMRLIGIEQDDNIVEDEEDEG